MQGHEATVGSLASLAMQRAEKTAIVDVSLLYQMIKKALSSVHLPLSSVQPMFRPATSRLELALDTLKQTVPVYLRLWKAFRIQRPVLQSGGQYYCLTPIVKNIN